MKYWGVFLLILFVFSCVGGYTCPNESFFPGLKGYATHEADSIIVKRYERGSNFTTLKDSIIFRYPDAIITATDTSYYFFNDQLDGQHDLTIINPFDHKSVQISEMKYDIREGRSGGCQGKTEICSSPLISYKRDGIPVSVTGSRAEQVVLTK